MNRTISYCVSWSTTACVPVYTNATLKILVSKVYPESTNEKTDMTIIQLAKDKRQTFTIHSTEI